MTYLIDLSLKMMITIYMISPYRYLDMWVFDDPRVGLVQEPFVSGADHMIDRLVADMPGAEQGFIFIFSDGQLPTYQLSLEWNRSDGDGNWYRSERLDMEGWLCPALLQYFSNAPKKIYVQVRPSCRSKV